ncbi:hypothetical protein RJ53_01640 [Methanocalculus chunghsingensis]|uniref:Polysaccharide biosynthesis protein n=1 Tax=Methanocalculus chunghsingensis TaxID=156457 RepID=A0A8J7W7W9_9EURY|nr:oligosaccharide flippase family protein [Methanocalculus chunghsingensis]MBR1368265.1 hypothetical protein [Methanocalculus chunghsingensis]
MSRFITNVLKLLSGSVLAQILGILLIPIITRLYSPGDYGVFQLFISISSIIAVMSCLSYQLAIVLPKKDEDSVNIIALCFVLILGTSLITGVVFILFSDFVGNMLKTPVLSQYLVFLPIVILLNGIFLVLNNWMIRRTQFSGVATAQVTNSFITKLVQIGAGINAVSAFGLIAGHIAGLLAALFIMARQMLVDSSLLLKYSLSEMKEMAIRYKRFPLFTTWATLANTLSTRVAPLLLAIFFGPTIVGHYAIAFMVIGMPMGLIGTAASQVFFQKISEVKNLSGNFKVTVEQMHKRLISIGIFPFLVVMIIGEELFAFMLGAEWSVAGQYAQILAPWIFLVFISAPLSTVLLVLEKQTVSLAFNLVILVSRIIILLVGGLFFNPIVTLILFSITGVLFIGFMNFYTLSISGVCYIETLKDLFTYLALAFVIASPIIIIKIFIVNIFIIFLITGVIMLTYYVVVIYMDPLLKKEIGLILKRK